MDDTKDSNGFFQTELSYAGKEGDKNVVDSEKVPTDQQSVVAVPRSSKPTKAKDGRSGLEKFKPEIATVHMRRTPTPSDSTRKPETEDRSSDGNLLKFLSMRKIARQVRHAQINRQKRLDYTGNETIEHKVRRFRPEDVEPTLHKFLKDNLQFVSYDPDECRQLSQELSEELRDIVKSLKYPRYKFVAMVTIGQKDKQTISIGSQSLWDTNMDTYVTSSYNNDSIFAVAMVFATFFD